MLQVEPTLRLTLDCDALCANWKSLDLLSGDAATGAAIKADAYGLGLRRVAPVLRAAGACDFFVAHWSEVPEALQHVDGASLSVFHGVHNRQEAAFARETGVRPVLNSLLQVQHWLDAGGGRCDLMVDTGINRLGLAMADIAAPQLQDLQIDTVMSHLASADEDVPQNMLQLARARQAFAAIPARRRSFANSAGIALGQDYLFDLTRPGLALYGGIPRDELAGKIRQVAFPAAAIMQIRQLQAGDGVGYNASYTAAASMRVGIVSLGYADGFLRCWGGVAALRHEGRILPVIGKVSMDMIVVDLGPADDLAEGDWLDVPYDLPQASKASGLSQYELLTTFGPRMRK